LSNKSHPRHLGTQPLSPTAERGWDLNYLDLTADFGVSSIRDVTLEYEIASGRAYSAQILADDCATPVEGGALELAAAERRPKDAYLDALTLGYDVDKSRLPGSNVWDGTTGDVRFCQVVRLVLPSGEAGVEEWVIAEDTRRMEVHVNLSAGFGVGVAPGTGGGGGPPNGGLGNGGGGGSPNAGGDGGRGGNPNAGG